MIRPADAKYKKVFAIFAGTRPKDADLCGEIDLDFSF